MLKRIGLVLLTGIMCVGIGSASVSAQGAGNSRTRTYAALGDSVAAGVGLQPPADTNTRCGRTTQAYAYKVAQDRGLSLIHAACSGATVQDLFTSQDGTIPPQLRTAFAQGTPQLITLTVGANDMHWADYLRKCAASTCGTVADDQATDALRAVFSAKLRLAFSTIQWGSGGLPPKVVVTGYSNPISNACIGKQPIADASEIAWLNSQRDKLNQAIRDAAAPYSFVKYASMDFTGHSICSPDPWFLGPNDPNSFHPNAAGQAAIAASVLDTFRP